MGGAGMRGPGRGSATAAAAGEQEDDEDDPDPVVVVEDVAQAVVHGEPPKYEVGGGMTRLHYHCMSDAGECAGAEKLFVGDRRSKHVFF